MIKILVASNGHKDYLSPREACNSIAAGLRKGCKKLDVAVAPMADGGDGTIEAITSATGGRVTQIEVHDPLFRPRCAKIGISHLRSKKTAVIEIAEAAGSAILQPHERQTMIATSYGVGEMLLAAVRQGCSRIIVGLGGSIVSDGGIGMAQALGMRFLDNRGKALQPVCNQGLNSLSLSQIANIKNNALRINPDELEILVASDVDIPLTGPNGQARTFGPQKNANLAEIEYLERGFANLARVVKKVYNRSIDVPLAGAAGGLGAGLLGFLGARLLLGAQVVADEINLESELSCHDVIVVGEGCLDHTTLRNKAPHFVGTMAKRMNKRVWAIVGKAQPHSYRFYDRLFSCGNTTVSNRTTSRSICRQLELVAASAAQEVLNVHSWKEVV